MVFSEDGTLVATSSTDATVKLWDGETGTLLHQLDSTSYGLSVDISPV
jgi:WD40 repeat protein